MIDSGHPPLILDVRTEADRRSTGWIPGAVFSSTPEEATATAHDTVVVYCDCPNEVSAAVLALAILVPGLWAAHVGSPRRRVVLCAALALVAMLSWDLFSHLVIMKVEPLQVLFGRPWAYVFGMVALSGVSLLSAYLGAPPRYS